MYNNVLLVLLVVSLCVYCFFVTVTDLSLASTLKSLDEKEVLSYILSKKFPQIDIVLMPPFIMDGDKNLTIVSVLRFMPWFRRIHIHDPSHEPSQHAADYWRAHKNDKLVFFHQSLLHYSMSSPFLAQHVIVLSPQFVFTNYVFGWHFFVNNSPVLRCSQSGGAIPLTRDILNEASYVNVDGNFDLILYALRKGTVDKRILYKNNRDHFVSACSSNTVKSLRRFSSPYNIEEVRSFLQFEEVAKDRSTRPLPIVIAVVDSVADSLKYSLPLKYASNIHVWVYLSKTEDYSERLSFTHRMIVSRNVFMDVAVLKTNSETVGANIMRQLRLLSNGEAFVVLEVFSYAHRGQPNEVGNKLAKTYNSPFSPFQENQENLEMVNREEWLRLHHL
jgi:hypothetical protein